MTPDFSAVEDYLFALKWAKSLGGLDALRHRADANANAIWSFCAARDWIDRLRTDVRRRNRIPGRHQVHVESQMAEAREVFNRLLAAGE